MDICLWSEISSLKSISTFSSLWYRKSESKSRTSFVTCVLVDIVYDMKFSLKYIIERWSQFAVFVALSLDIDLHRDRIFQCMFALSFGYRYEPRSHFFSLYVALSFGYRFEPCPWFWWVLSFRSRNRFKRWPWFRGYVSNICPWILGMQYRYKGLHVIFPLWAKKQRGMILV